MDVAVSELRSRSRRHETRGAGIGGVDRRSRSCRATGVGSGARTSVVGVATASLARSPAVFWAKNTLCPVLASREAPWRTRGTSTSLARYVVFTRASPRSMRRSTNTWVVSRQRPSPTRRRARFRRVSGPNPSFRRSARTRAERHRPRSERPSPRDFETDLRDPRTPAAVIDRWRNRSVYRRKRPRRACGAFPGEPSRAPFVRSSYIAKLSFVAGRDVSSFPLFPSFSLFFPLFPPLPSSSLFFSLRAVADARRLSRPQGARRGGAAVLRA